MKYVIASNNASKLEELQRILGELGIEIVTARQLGVEPPEPVENGDTFAENARIKARAFVEACGLPAIADDSGLCVDALGGAPGVHSARYGGDHDVDSAISLLLRELDGVPHERRTARYECNICVLEPSGASIEAHGMCEGFIADAPQGHGGFGFDPVFLLPDGSSFGELSAKYKDSVSHRGNALRELKHLLESR